MIVGGKRVPPPGRVIVTGQVPVTGNIVVWSEDKERAIAILRAAGVTVWNKTQE